MSELRLQLLGRFQVRRGGVEVAPAAFGGRKVRALLRVLAVRSPDLVTHEVLAEALWPDRLPADPAANLGVLVNRARRAVGESSVIVTGTGGYALGECTVDVTEFLEAADRARAATDDTAVMRSAAAGLAMWAEPLVEDTYTDWAREPRERLHRVHVDLAERAARAVLALGDPARAVSWAMDAVAADPLRESAVLVLARASAAAGDLAGALARLAELQYRLADELGVDPSSAVDALRIALLDGERPPDGQVSAPASSRAPPAGGQPRSVSVPVFVGRDAELARLREAVRARHVATLAGVAGVGKSRVLAELVRDSSLPVLAARAFLPERTEAWGLARSMLREAVAQDSAVVDGLPSRVRWALADVLPELDATETEEGLDGESRRALILSGGLRILGAATGAGALLVVDDLQWADPSSLLLLASALARLPRLATVLTFRPDEIAASVPADLRSIRASTEIVVGPLPPDAVSRLLRDPGLVAAVLESTDCTPFAITEVLRELLARGAVTLGSRGGWIPRSPAAAALAAELGHTGQAAAVRRRAGRQTGSHAELLALLALLAREAPASTLAEAAGLEPRTALEALSGLADAGLVRLGERGWATAHDLVTETVTAGLEVGDRGRLHALLARALNAEDADHSEIARHHRDAGDTAAAAASFAHAAQGALTAHATREAFTLADAGLALAPRPGTRADLLTVRAEAGSIHGDHHAVDDLRAALAATPAGPLRSRRLSRLAMLIFGAQDPQRASELAELAIVAAAGDNTALALALETAAILDMNLDRADRARERAEKALALHRRLGDAAGAARILDGRAMATFLEGRIATAMELFGRAAGLFTDSGELLQVVTPRSTLGHGLVFMDRPAEGLVETDTALRLACDLDTPEGQAYALWHRSEALSALGRTEEAEADAIEALHTAQRVGHRGWTATAHRARGIALTACGDLDSAAAAFTASAAAAGDTLTLFASWAAARTALVAVARGNLDRASTAVERALTLGPPLGHYEARLADVELHAARGDPATPRLAATALRHATKNGHRVTIHRLVELAGTPV
ncbi:BTAD domain-containing putative transcriptional regulator [Actinomycetospora sp.]|jgi:DNA-binding SARP family transcriptional activator/tetratricopeptide (TPR) repeat protein|uniref:BTAD domain-containing putative transcriptional regulator n=1 Tax=Actinomycetospora sp. TaxID=1872135 RepID=UPI002F3FACB1